MLVVRHLQSCTELMSLYRLYRSVHKSCGLWFLWPKKAVLLMISCLVDFTHSPLSSLKLFEHSSTKTSTSASSNQLHPPMQPPSSSSRRRMALSNCVSTTKDSTRYPRRTGILYPSSLTSLTPWVRRRSILKLILGMLTIWFASPREMSGKLPSTLATAPMMPFGLTNAPATFQWFVNSVFTDMLDVCMVVYCHMHDIPMVLGTS